MHTKHKTLLVLSMLGALGGAPLVHAAPDSSQARPMGSVERSHARQAENLLAQAVEHLEKRGAEQALADFNARNGRFAMGEYYVFVLDQAGTMRASSGASHSLVGLDVSQLQDAAGKNFMAAILSQAKGAQSGAIDYHWLNPANNKLENKTSLFRRVGDYVVCVGYYIPRSSAEQARALLDKAVALLQQEGGDAAYRRFNDPQGGFVIGDEYVFAIGLEDGKYRASGGSPSLVGTDVREVRDAAGKPLFRDMIELARSKGEGNVDYVWRNPATNAVEPKHTLIRRVDDVLLGVGYYSPR
ncbi:cache domain-containing protein [Pseudomonas oligotrophica]|uniref:cache domain-containing protein n=1 Tax=Pseudomonas oligotrophica TaxID=2912055 RepID=UPI001F323A41|nr:cache domain-containing protein [Pseudomonas oligotrophica]MCF7201247.1 cache domain-containing protein [Pseudomonas oligotrophica]